mgnify:CR=1 FL=1
MVIRYANEKDNFKTLAKLMYETDRYMYPYWFETKEEGIEEISKLLTKEHTSFFYKKCIVAEVDGEIVGMLLYFDDTSPLDFAYADIIGKNFNYSYTLKNYVIPLEKSIKEIKNHSINIGNDILFSTYIWKNSKDVYNCHNVFYKYYIGNHLFNDVRFEKENFEIIFSDLKQLFKELSGIFKDKAVITKWQKYIWSVCKYLLTLLDIESQYIGESLLKELINEEPTNNEKVHFDR